MKVVFGERRTKICHSAGEASSWNLADPESKQDRY